VIGLSDERHGHDPLARTGGRVDDRHIDSPARSIAMKTLTYGTMHFGVAFATAWALTGSVRLAGAIALVEPVVQTGAYVLHERAWERRERWAARGRVAKDALCRAAARLGRPARAVLAAEPGALSRSGAARA
jgi:uncharacterized membrane protein